MARKCTNCGAPLKRGRTTCEYCGVDVETGVGIYRAGVPTVEPIVPTANGAPRSGPMGGDSVSAAKIGVFVLLLCFCAPAAVVYMWLALPWPKSAKRVVSFILLAPFLAFAVYGYLSETTYAVKSSTTKFEPQPVAESDRAYEEITAQDVFNDMRQEGNRTLPDLRARWSERFEGRWVKWTAPVKQVDIYTTMASELRLSPDASEVYDIEIFFDPIHNPELEALAPGMTATVSGRLWGYYFLTDRVRLADGMLLGSEAAPPDAPETDQASTEPET